MADENERKRFAQEFESRFNALAQWAIENWPDKNRPLSSTDFAQCRLAISTILHGAGQPDNKGLEPEHGGAQYVNVAPAPWP